MMKWLWVSLCISLVLVSSYAYVAPSVVRVHLCRDNRIVKTRLGLIVTPSRIAISKQTGMWCDDASSQTLVVEHAKGEYRDGVPQGGYFASLYEIENRLRYGQPIARLHWWGEGRSLIQ